MKKNTLYYYEEIIQGDNIVINFIENLKIGHLMGRYALEEDEDAANRVKRLVSEKDFINFLGKEEFEKYKPIFNYMDKYDNKKIVNDGYIDVVCFANGSEVEGIENTEDVLYTGELFYNNNRAKKLALLLKTSLDNLQKFFNNLVKISGVKDRIGELKTTSEENYKEVVSYNSYNKPIAKMIYEGSVLIEKKEYTYNKKGELEKILTYNKDNEQPSSKSEFYYFNTEKDANNYIEILEKTCDECEISKQNDKYVVVAEYEL